MPDWGIMARNFPESFKKFSCIKCGKCCTLSVAPSEQDIKKIERLGHKRLHFLRKGHLRKNNGICCFAEKRDGQFHCNIHEMKPKTCRDYPFTVLNRDKLFSCPALHEK